MISRLAYASILKDLGEWPVVSIIGPRQVGKTTVARKVASTRPGSIYLDLELTSDQNRLADAELYLGRHKDRLVVIDEIQRKPELFPLLRALIDQDRRPGRFLILGSASPPLLQRSSESLAGRVVHHELAPLSVKEAGKGSTERLWVRGGYPLSFLAKNDDASVAWRDGLLRAYIESELPGLGFRIPAASLRRFIGMLANSHGQVWNASRIAGSLGVTAPTIQRYLDILADTFMARVLPPLLPNLTKRLTRSPKVYLRDTGLLHSLLGIRSFDDLMSSPLAGASWEGFVVEQVVGFLPPGWHAWFHRTRVGAEIDLVVTDRKGRAIAVEVKYSLSPKLARGFHEAWADLKCRRGFVVYPGKERFPLTPAVDALPVTEIESAVFGS